MGASPQRVDGLAGSVRCGTLGCGSKSEREAVWLDTDQGCYALRLKNAPSFGDTTLDGVAGRRVSCRGFIVDSVLLADRIELID